MKLTLYPAKLDPLVDHSVPLLPPDGTQVMKCAGWTACRLLERFKLDLPGAAPFSLPIDTVVTAGRAWATDHAEILTVPELVEGITRTAVDFLALAEEGQKNGATVMVVA